MPKKNLSIQTIQKILHFEKDLVPVVCLNARLLKKATKLLIEQFGKVGKQKIENTGPLTKKRMETVDEEFIDSALDFIGKKTKEGTPWFCYFNPTRMHVFTHLKPSSVGKTGLGLYPDGMVELDGLCRPVAKKT